MPLNRVPDTVTRPEEIEDPVLLVHRVLYRTGHIGEAFREDDLKPLVDRKTAIERINGANRADLHRLEELLESDVAA